MLALRSRFWVFFGFILTIKQISYKSTLVNACIGSKTVSVGGNWGIGLTVTETCNSSMRKIAQLRPHFSFPLFILVLLIFLIFLLLFLSILLLSFSSCPVCFSSFAQVFLVFASNWVSFSTWRLFPFVSVSLQLLFSFWSAEEKSI